jgi:lipopolysaccharide export LptBFGC system permease protein LptF
MSATDLLAVGLCLVLIVAGAVAIRRSRRQRGIGAMAIVLGVIGMLAYATVERGTPPPRNETPTPELVAPASPDSSTPEHAP